MSAKNNFRNRTTQRQPAAWRGWLLFGAAVVATFALGVLAASILQRREEAKASLPLQPIAEYETDNSKWAVNWPRQYDSYRAGEESSSETKFGGAYPRDLLAETPANVILFAGYGFAKEYRQARGHLHAVEDVVNTARVGPTTVATCWTCKSPDVVRLMADMGPAEFYKQTFDSLKGEVTHPVGCLDCHDPKTMVLKITRPALVEALERQGRDLKNISHQEMRSLVCAQCHVEYYFKGEGNYLTFPWDDGTGIEAMAKYYDEPNFSDWTHAISGAPMVKMQHPDYEVYTKGIHAFRNVACADCHMPYKTEGGSKFTDHHVRSPLLNIANSCAVCHRWDEEEIRSRVESIQSGVREGRDRAEETIAKAHFDIAAAKQAGANDEQLKEARRLVREAQLRWDYVAANNGMGFHAPQECLRILAAAVEMAGQCRVECARILARNGVTEPIAYPDFSTKEKAQALMRAFVDGNPPKLVP
ncbi:MAG TPA: ammonia-forming cytochrome c nitrite reductase subunit c552 [Planctomycetaceae bacterium]|nr:ammonia-forming cytochrome c nitrite reductase subunit c552 [Planctomycetaceae bacterium]